VASLLMSQRSTRALDRLSSWGLILLPGVLLIFLSFNAGGFFPGTPALVAVVLLLLLASRIILVPQPFAGFSPALAVAAGALSLYAVWALLSATWSDSTWRALIEFDRALLYLLALVLFGSRPRDSGQVRWMTRCLALAILVVCSIGLVTRLAPDLWPIAPNLGENRLSYPITYWNSLGLLASLGTILCLHFTSSRSEPRALRLAGAAAIPILVTTLFFTFSRGAIVAGAIGLVAYMVLGRPRALLSGLLATVPTAAIALTFSYQADKLAGLHPTSSAATSQGHDIGLILCICVAAALWLRWLLLALDRHIGKLRLPPRARLPVLGSLAAAVVVAGVVLFVALDGPSYVSDQYGRFLHGNNKIGNARDLRTRLSDPGNNGRIDQWRVAISDGFEPSKLDGQGAGTFELVWARNRPPKRAGLTVHDAHSLYIENLSDLGLVGLLLVLAFVLAILYGFAVRLGGPNRTLYAALFAAGLAWALRAGADWDWEMPAVTLWVFALGGAALAAPARAPRLKFSPSPALRAGIAMTLIVIGVVPAVVTISQGKLDHAVQTFLRRGDCSQVIDEARSASSVLPLRPEPYRLEGYCQARLGQTRRAVDSMQEAVDRDPGNWQYRYSLAVAQAAAGVDPRPAAREALRLNPLEPATRDLVKRFPSANPRLLRDEAAALLRAPVF
jgi:O-Antigen ligase